MYYLIYSWPKIQWNQSYPNEETEAEKGTAFIICGLPIFSQLGAIIFSHFSDEELKLSEIK